MNYDLLLSFDLPPVVIPLVKSWLNIWTCPHLWANHNVIFLKHTLFTEVAAYTRGDTFSEHHKAFPGVMLPPLFYLFLGIAAQKVRLCPQYFISWFPLQFPQLGISPNNTDLCVKKRY
jgi:hypothetical protein